MVNYSESYIKEILDEVKTIAVVGASANQDRDSYKVMQVLIQHGYQIFPINPNEEGNLILGQPCYADLSSVSGKIDMVDVFRAADAVMGVTKEAIAIGATVSVDSIRYCAQRSCRASRASWSKSCHG